MAASAFAGRHAPLSTQKLRRLVTQLKGCLSSLAPQQTEVLVLRTGIGLRHAFSRRTVAQILGVSVQKELQIEQAAVLGLNRASAHSSCANSSVKLPASVRTAVLQAARGIVALSEAAAVPGTSAPVPPTPS